MLDFIYENKCEIHFGKLPESRIIECIKKFGGTTVLLHYGGGSIIKNGLYAKIRKAFTDANLKLVELGGVCPNPIQKLAMQGVDIARREMVDFVLAVGGGSVIDSAKFIAAGVNNKDIWDYYSGKKNADDLKNVLPVGAVLTIPSAGSECSTPAGIKIESCGKKYWIRTEKIRPKFAFINPEYCTTVPLCQIAYGASDIFSHLFERFFADDSVGDSIVTDKLLIGAMHALLELAPKVYADINDHDSLANFCVLGSIAQNNMLSMGRGRGCFASHDIDETLLSGLKDIAHGEGLAIVIPAYLKLMQKKKPRRVEQFTREVISIAGLEKFYKSLGLPVRLSDMNISADEIKTLAKLNFPANIRLGGYGQLNIKEIESVLELAK